MRIDLTVPTSWKELTTEQLRFVVDLAKQGLNREEFLLALLCRFADIKMVGGSSIGGPLSHVSTTFKDKDGHTFTLDAAQVADFCKHLTFTFDEKMTIDTPWPFPWNRYLIDTTFEHWFRADALMMGFATTSDNEYLTKVVKELTDPAKATGDTDTLTDADRDLLLIWYDCFKDWLHERYPLVFQKAEPGGDAPASPVESRQNIMLMLNGGRPQDNEAIERSNVHDVLSALQHKIEEAKHIEEQLHRK
jgi:hypothetical protein